MNFVKTMTLVRQIFGGFCIGFACGQLGFAFWTMAAFVVAYQVMMFEIAALRDDI